VRLLLDTHAFLWWVGGSPRLSMPARNAVSDEDAQVYISAASVWEIVTKHRLGKLPEHAVIATDVAKTINERGFDSLAISLAHAQHAGALAGAHKDPFDRVLAAQALLDGLVLVSKDSEFDAFGVRRLW